MNPIIAHLIELNLTDIVHYLFQPPAPTEEAHLLAHIECKSSPFLGGNLCVLCTIKRQLYPQLCCSLKYYISRWTSRAVGHPNVWPGQSKSADLTSFFVPLQRIFKPENPTPGAGADLDDHTGPWTLRLLAERQPNLNLVIDLTFTTKYYNPRDLEGSRVNHVKIFAKGHEVPNNQVVRK